MKITGADADIDYIENFYASAEAEVLFHELAQSLAWRHDDIQMFGKVMKIPRLQA